MCGIYGFFRTSESANAPRDADVEAWLDRADELLRHRGPDGCTRRTLMNGRCQLGHRRLSIIDLEGGTQPIANEDGSVWVILNGEIYNYVELREQLIAKGHRFRTQSDTEVLVHLYEEKGHALLDDLDGMFAFAIVDEKKEQVFLARDRYGEKPLYYAPLNAGRDLVFASEMKALVDFPGVDKRLDVAAIAQFLAVGYVPAPRTHIIGLRKLIAGEALAIDRMQGVRTWRYWRPRVALNEANPIGREEAIEEIKTRIRDSVRLRLRSDVSVGAFLSGGVDSTYIAATIREIQPNKLNTFCASFDDEQLNEAPYARRIAERLETDHHEVHFSSNELLKIFNELIDHYDEPFADVSMFPTFAVCRAARQVCKVMLSGDGGDECFGGYTEMFGYYRWNDMRRNAAMGVAAKAASALWRSNWRGAGLVGFLAKSDWELLYPARRRQAVNEYFTPEFRSAAENGFQELEERAREHARLPYPLSVFESTASAYLPEQIMVKVDRASMRASLECRAPFLDAELMGFVNGLPVDYHFNDGMGKILLREALPAWVPDEIRWRQKRGFTPPLCRWLRGELKGEVEKSLTEDEGAMSFVFNAEPMKRLFREHQNGSDHSNELFRWLVLSRRCRNAELN